MTVFNRKYSKIIKLASSFDEELNSQLQHMLSKLNKQHLAQCFVGEEFHDDENRVWFENFNRFSPKNVAITESNLMYEEGGDTHFGLNLANISEAWLDGLTNYKNLQTAKTSTGKEDNNLLVLYVYKYKNGNIEDLELGLSYCLKLFKINGKLVLDYLRCHFTEFHGERTIETQSTQPADESELYYISKLTNPIVVV